MVKSITQKEFLSALRDARFLALSVIVLLLLLAATVVGLHSYHTLQHERETAQLKAEFDAKVAAVDQYANQYDDARRQEIEALRTRYTAAYDKREATWNNRQKRQRANDSLAAPNSTSSGFLQAGQYYQPGNPATQLTAANARAIYESFVLNTKQNESRYTLADWRTINAEWRALDEAYDQVKGDIPARDR